MSKKPRPIGENEIVQRLHAELTLESQNVFASLVATGGPEMTIATFASLPRKRQVELFRAALQLLALDFEPENGFADEEDDAGAEENDEEE